VDLEALALSLQTGLMEVLREQRGAVYSVDVKPRWSADDYTLSVQFECLPADVSALQDASWRVIGQLTRAQLSDAAVEAVKARLRERYVRGMVADQFWAEELELAYTYDTPPADILQLPVLSESLTRDRLAVAAQRYLPRDRHLDAVWSPGE
jgi:predicted Zn-dependent peptidase